jgi:pyruvyltransferase
LHHVAEVVYWHDQRPHPLVRRAPAWISGRIQRPERNFGDRLGPLIVRMMLGRMRLPESSPPHRRLLTVGSIMHLAQPGDVVWGSGRNGRISDEQHCTDGLDVRAVRGPLTRDWLLDRGASCPEVFGDPALLLPLLRPDLVVLARRKRFPVTYVWHIDDSNHRTTRGVNVLSPRASVERVMATLVQSELVVATSLHAIIVAEAFGVPARSIVNVSEPEFKFTDYYRSTGRNAYQRATSIEEAIRMGGERPPVIALEGLLAAFPCDLFNPAMLNGDEGRPRRG